MISGSSSELSWINWFCSSRGHDFFCEVDYEYIEDKFNLTGLQECFPSYNHALDVIMDADQDGRYDDAYEAEAQLPPIDDVAEQLYGLIHSRYIMTVAGCLKMREKWIEGRFEMCPRVYCDGQHCLPIGLSDTVGSSTVKLYCPRCQDVYRPKARRYELIDGAYFGTGFPHMFFMIFPELRPKRALTQFVGRLYGFKIHPIAYQLQYKAAADSQQSNSLEVADNLPGGAGSWAPPKRV